MVVTFVTVAPWAIAFVGRLSRGDSSLSFSLSAAALLLLLLLLLINFEAERRRTYKLLD
jgi:hypothetical protein